jgi:hypothetical protein
MVSELLQALPLCPPGDAYGRTRRRFHLLDRPFAMRRGSAPAPQQPRAKSAAKRKPGSRKKKNEQPTPPPGELF